MECFQISVGITVIYQYTKDFSKIILFIFQSILVDQLKSQMLVTRCPKNENHTAFQNIDWLTSVWGFLLENWHVCNMTN